jgi:hypothetical protein
MSEAPVRTRRYDDWTIDRWRLEPRFPALHLDEPSASEQAPALWKDLAIASVAAALLWAAAAMVIW